MELKNNKKEFDWRTMLKCMVCQWFFVEQKKYLFIEMVWRMPDHWIFIMCFHLDKW